MAPPQTGPEAPCKPSSSPHFCFPLSPFCPCPLSRKKTPVSGSPNPDHSALLAEQSPKLAFTSTTPTGQVIDVDSAKTYQTMDGFGYALTGGSAMLIHHMAADKRAALLHNLFTTEGDRIGVSYLRLTVGSSDMNDHVYSYDDLPEGQTDPDIKQFSLAPDETDVIPVLKEILAINPKIKILGSPWSAPLWMKTNGEAQGGVLLPSTSPPTPNIS